MLSPAKNISLAIAVTLLLATSAVGSPRKARTLGRRLLREIATIVTPDTLLAWL